MSVRKPSEKVSLSIIIPAYNEARTINNVLNDLTAVLNNYRLQIIVVDDGSTDNTQVIARRKGIKVISLPNNSGKGAAFRTGLKYATGQYIVQIDADGQLKAFEIPKLINKLKEGYDLVLGARYNFITPFNSGFTSLIKMGGNYFLSFITTVFTGTKIIDVMTGLKAFKKGAVRSLHLKSDDFGYEAEIVVRAAQLNYKIANVYIKASRRQTGRSNLKTIKHGLAVLSTIVRAKLFQ